MEAECALRLARLASERPVTGVTPAEQLGALLAAYEVAQPFPLTNAQREAVQMAHRHRLMVLAGYAGSGKTTGLRGVCETLEGAGRNPLIVTLSGRAAKRAAEATGRRAITVARFLIDQEGDEQPLDATATLIVDEASMLGLVEVWRILRQIGEASLILCGDPAQLPPISPGIVYHHLAAAPGVARVVLDRVHRQDEASGIPVLAEGVRNGETSDLPPFSGILPGVSFISCTQDALPDELLRLGREIAAGGTRRDDVQIVAPTNATIGDINAFFHRLAMQRDPAVWPFTGHIAEGEPVLWTQNDPERGLTNGALGRVQRVTDDEIVVALDGQVHTLDPADGANLQLAYAISVHKAQGSQWQRVIVPVFRSRIVDRSLIYTALTRAQEQLIFLGDEKALWAAVSRPPAAERRDVAFEDWLALARGQAGLI